MAIRSRFPLVLSKHIGTQKPKKDPFHRWIYRHVDFIVANSSVIERNVIRTHPVPPRKVGVIHPGVDLQGFRYWPEDRHRLRQEWGVREEDILIGIAGRLQRAKGYLEFLEMAYNLSRRYPRVRFLLLGEATRGEEEEARDILSRIDELKLGDRVIVAGFRQDVPQVLSAMDIFVFPSHAEAFGLVLLEAMAVGLPVVSSNCDGVLDIVEDGINGYLVPPKDVKRLTEATERLILKEKRRRQLGQAARQRVEQSFGFEGMVDQLEALYYRLAAAG